MGFIILILVIIVAVFYLLKKKERNYVNQQVANARENIVYSTKSEAEKHYRKGNNLWADNFHAALAEFEMALRLEPENKDYQFAVKHAKENIEQDENS